LRTFGNRSRMSGSASLIRRSKIDHGLKPGLGPGPDGPAEGRASFPASPIPRLQTAIAPSAPTISTALTHCLTLPHRTEAAPAPLVATIPPSVANRPLEGIGGKRSPAARAALLSSWAVMAALVHAVWRAGSSSSRRGSTPVRSTTTPRPTLPPPIPLPAPRGTSAMRPAAAQRTSACRSATSAGTATASGTMR
jgi:hypothetical protein